MSGITALGIGPILDWTLDNGLLQRFQVWKRKVNIIFSSALAKESPEIKCNYLTYWSGDKGSELVEQWKTSKKLAGADLENPEKYFDLFQKHISPKTNALIAVIELRRLTQGNMSLEDFHAQCVKLIDESEFPNDARDRLLRDTLIHGISSDSSRTKIVKKGKDISLNDVLDICRTQVAVDQQMSCITPSKQISYLKYGNNKKAKPPPKAKPMTGHGTVPQGSKCFRCGRGTHQKDQKCPASDATCRHCGRKGHYEVICQQKLRQGNKGGNGWKSSSGGNPKKASQP